MAEGLEPPPSDDNGMTPMPFTDGERQNMKEAFQRERAWRIEVEDQLTAANATISRLQEVVSAAKAFLRVPMVIRPADGYEQSFHAANIHLHTALDRLEADDD